MPNKNPTTPSNAGNITREDLRKTGYSQEEEYFYKLNRELIEKRREELDSKLKTRTAQEQKSLHWMKCPKCGNQMEQNQLSGIYVDQCKSCHGIYFDQGEAETLIQSTKPNVFLKLLKKLFVPRDEAPTLF